MTHILYKHDIKSSISLSKSLRVNDVLSLSVWSQNEEIVLASDPTAGNIKLSVAEAGLSQLKASHFESLTCGRYSLVNRMMERNLFV